MIRDYPAYGRTIASLIARGQKPICVAVLLSARWRYFDDVPKVCLKPDEWRMGRYEFGYLAGMHVVAVPGDECTDAQLGELLLDLMRAGPRLLWAYGIDGKKLYDGDWPTDLWHWIFDLCGRQRQYRELKAAASFMEAAQARARSAWLKEYQVIEARSGMDAALKFHLQTDHHIPDRVRELFSSPAGSEARAA